MTDPISDPSDWASTTLPDLASLDSALRCQICKDFFEAPVMTNCCHTFCSLCIRRALAATGQCPLCRTNEQEYRLRKNTTVAEVLETFRASRGDILKAAAKVQEREKEVPVVGSQQRRGKREKATAASAAAAVIEVGEGDGDCQPEEDVIEEVSDDGLVGCPMCQRRMKEAAVFVHLDTCPGPSPVPTPATSSRTRTSSRNLRSSQPTPSSTPTPTLEPLPKITYHHLNDTKLRAKLKELGIPNSGARKLLQERHTEWMNLWNANVDSERPKTKRELLTELNTWERAHTRPQNNKTKSENWSDADWGQKNKRDFDELVAKARAGAKKRKVETTEGQDGMSGQQVEGSPKKGLPGGASATPDRPEQNGSAAEASDEITSPFFANKTVLETQLMVEGPPPPPNSQDRSRPPSGEKRKYAAFEDQSMSGHVI